ncbi:MAG: hypothetical protein ACXVCS_08950 [Bdellovibrionota bacterium]
MKLTPQVSLFLAFLLWASPSRADTYDPSKCAHHDANPNEYSRDVYSRSKPICTQNAQIFADYDKYFHGEHSFDSRVDKLVQEADAISQEYMNKAKADSVNQAEAAAAVNDLLSKMRAKREELLKLDQELQKVVKKLKEDVDRNAKLFTPLSQRVVELDKEARKKLADVTQLKSQLQPLQTNIDALSRQDKQNTENNAVNNQVRSDLQRAQNNLKQVNDRLNVEGPEAIKEAKGVADIRKALEDVKVDHNGFQKVGQDYNKDAVKLRVAESRVTMVDPQANATDKDEARKMLEMAKVPVPGAGNGASAPDGSAKPASTANGAPAAPGLTKDEQEFNSMIQKGGSEASKQFEETNKLTADKIAKGEVGPQVLAGNDAVEKTLNLAQKNAVNNLADYAGVFADPEKGPKAQEDIKNFKDGVTPSLNTLTNMQAVRDPNADTSWYGVPKFVPADRAAADAAYKDYNDKFDKLSPMEQRYVTEVMHMPNHMDDSKLYYDDRAAHDVLGKSSGSTWSNWVDGAYGYSKAAVTGQLTSFTAGSTTTTKDPGWLSIAETNLPQNQDAFVSKYNDTNIEKMRSTANLALNQTEGMGTLEYWRNNFVTTSYDDQLKSWDASKTAVENAKEAVKTGTPSVFDEYGNQASPQAELVAAEEKKRDLAAHILGKYAYTTGEAAAYDPSISREALEAVKYDKTNIIYGNDRWVTNERKEMARDMILGTVGGPLGQEFIAMKSAEKYNIISAAADTYKTNEMVGAAATALDERNSNQLSTGVAGVFTATGQTMIVGGAYKFLKAGYMESSAARMILNEGQVAARVSQNAVRDTEYLARTVPEIYHAAPAVERAAPQAIRVSDDTYRAASGVGSSGNYISHAADYAPSISRVENSVADAGHVTAVADRAAPAAERAGYAVVEHSAPVSERAATAVTQVAEHTGASASHAPAAAAYNAAEDLKSASHSAISIAKTAGKVDETVSSGSLMARAADGVGQSGARLASAAVESSSSLRQGERGVQELERITTTAPTIARASAVANDATVAARSANEAASMAHAAEQTARAAYESAKISGDAGKIEKASLAVKVAEQTTVQAEQSAQVATKVAAASRGVESAAKAANVAKEAETEARAGLAAAKASGDSGRVAQAEQRVAMAALVTKRAEDVSRTAEIAAKDTKNAAKEMAEAGKDELEVSKEAVTPRTFAAEAEKMLKPGSKVDRYLDHIANLSAIKAAALKDEAYLAKLAKEEGTSTAVYMRKLDRRIDFFEHKLHENYSFPKNYLEQYKEALLHNGFAPEELADMKRLLVQRAVLDSSVAKVLVDGAAKKIENAMVAAVEKGDRPALEAAMKAAQVPEKLTSRVMAAMEDAQKTGRLTAEELKQAIPAISRDLAGAGVLTRKAPQLGHDMFENLTMIFNPENRMAAGLTAGAFRTYVSNPIVRVSRWVTNRPDYFRGIPKMAVKDFTQMELEARLAKAALGSGEALTADVARMAKIAKESETLSDSAEHSDLLASAKDESHSAAKVTAPAGSLLAESQALGGKIEGSVRSLLESSYEVDPVRRQLQVENAVRSLVVDNRIPKAEVEKLRSLVEGGKISRLTAEEISAKSEELAQARFLSNPNVAPRVASAERSLESALKAAAKSGDTAGLRKLGLEEEQASRLLGVEAYQPGLAKRQGLLRNVAEAVVLGNDAGKMQKKNLLLNVSERMTNFAKGSAQLSAALVMASGHGLWAGAKWAASFADRKTAKDLGDATWTASSLKELRLASRGEAAQSAAYWILVGAGDASDAASKTAREAALQSLRDSGVSEEALNIIQAEARKHTGEPLALEPVKKIRSLDDIVRQRDLGPAATEIFASTSGKTDSASQMARAVTENALLQSGKSRDEIDNLIRDADDLHAARNTNLAKAAVREMIVAAQAPATEAAVRFKAIENALVASGRSAESVQAARQLVERDVTALRGMMAGSAREATPGAMESLIANTLTEHNLSQSYESLLAVNKLETPEQQQARISQLFERLNQEKAIDHTTRESVSEAIARMRKENKGDLEISANGVTDSSGKVIKNSEGGVAATADGKVKLMLHESSVKEGQLAAEATLAHESVHVKSMQLANNIDNLQAKLASGGADANAVSRQLAEASSRSITFAAHEGASVLKGSEYSNFFAMDEIQAHIEGARKEAALARMFIAQGQSREANLRASASLGLSKDSLVRTKEFAGASRLHLSAAENILADDANELNYNSATGKAWVRVPAETGFVQVDITLPKGLAQPEALTHFRQAANFSLEEIDRSAAKSHSYLAQETERLRGRLARGEFGKLTGGSYANAHPTLVRGTEMYTKAALQNTDPAIQEAVRLRDVTDAVKADERRAQLAQVTKPSSRIPLLTQEEDYLARQLAVAADEFRTTRSPDASQRMADLEREHAAVTAQLLGNRIAREKEFENGARDVAKNFVQSLDESAFAPYQADHFPGLTFEQVLADPVKSDLFTALRERDLALEAKYAREARESLVSSIEKHISGVAGSPGRPEKMAEDLAFVQSIASGESEKVTAALAERGWSKAQVGDCVREGICLPKFSRETHAVLDTEASPIARSVLLEDKLALSGTKAAEEARTIAKLPVAGVSKDFETAMKDLEGQKSALAKEAVAKKVALDAKPGDAAIQAAFDDVTRAQASVQSRIEKLSESKDVLKSAGASTAEELDRKNQAVGSMMKFFENPPKGQLAKIDSRLADKTLLDGIARGGDARFEAYGKLKGIVEKLPSASKSQLFKLAEAGVANTETKFGKALQAAAKVEDAALSRAITKSEEIGGATNSVALSSAAAKAEIKSGEHLALAEALGVVKAKESPLEAEAAAKAEKKALEAQTKAVTSAEAKIARKAERAPASIATESVNDAAKRELAQVHGIDYKTKNALADSIASMEKDKVSAESRIQRMIALSSNPDLFETYQMAYVDAAAAFHAAASSGKPISRDKAWKEGVRKMLLDSGYSKKEVDAGLLKKTAACLTM